MPRAATTASRRAKRDAQQPVPQKLARTAASVRAAAMANASASGGAESVSAPPIVKMKPEPTRTPIPAAAATKAKATVSSSPQRAPWRHPDELAYIRTAGKTWDDMAIARFLAGNAFGVPARNTNTLDPWVRVECADGSEVAVPRGYRFALLWVAKYLWTSVKLVLTAEDAIRQREWDGTKFEILHIARLCAALLGKARDAAAGGAQMERAWRCPQFDRALHRYWHEWLLMGDAFVRDFFREFGEEEYKTDVLKFPWSRWVLKSHKGFALTKEESADGISAAEFTRGFVVDEEKGTYEWKSDPDTPPAASSGDVDIAEAEVKAKPKATAVSASDVSKTTFSQEMVQTPATEQTPATAQKLIPVDDQVQMTVAAHASPSRVSFLVRPHGAFRPPPQVQPQPQPEGKATSQAAATDLAMAFDSADDSVEQGGVT
ncbi:hypothetical protein K438DRAFT_257710 [Mycena galopus ATCC 62051]|nr:hypothetical protein K438DRAFT_257710 [Mycena galopus ATCC 62051]